MNRRNFFKRISICAAAVAVAPSVIEALATELPRTATGAEYYLAPQGFADPVLGEQVAQNAIINQYVDYVSFSAFAWTENFDPNVIQLSEQLAKARARSINRLTGVKRLALISRRGTKIFTYDLSPSHQRGFSPAHRISPD